MKRRKIKKKNRQANEEEIQNRANCLLQRTKINLHPRLLPHAERTHVWPRNPVEVVYVAPLVDPNNASSKLDLTLSMAVRSDGQISTLLPSCPPLFVLHTACENLTFLIISYVCLSTSARSLPNVLCICVCVSVCLYLLVEKHGEGGVEGGECSKPFKFK